MGPVVLDTTVLIDVLRGHHPARRWLAGLDGDLARWSPADVSEILLGLYPAKVMLDEEDLDLIPVVVAAFLRHLGEADVVADAEPGARRAEEVAAEFRSRAGDPDNWSFGKRLWGDAAASGVDLEDPGSVQRFIAEFNERPRAERDEILGPPSTPGWHGPPGMAPSMGSLPPVVLAPPEELAAIAAGNRWVQRMADLVDFVGDGRALTDRGNLKLADGKALVELLDTGDPFDEDRPGGIPQRAHPRTVARTRRVRRGGRRGDRDLLRRRHRRPRRGGGLAR